MKKSLLMMVLLIFVIALGVDAGEGSSSGVAKAMPGQVSVTSRPNIVLILVDDMGYSDIGCFGGEIKTPNIDKLAGNGIRFTQFSNCAKCETTRRTLMSGRYHTEVNKDKAGITIPENLGLVGYQNFMVGKWHHPDTPITRGFDRYYGFLEGAVNHITGEGTKGDNSFRIDEEPHMVKGEFYSTDSFTDWALKYIDEREKEKPFFMYVAYNAPHYPLQAPKEEVMKYRGKYKDGWAALREKRFARMKEMDIIPQDTILSKPEENVKKWESLSDERKDNMDLRMATYAGMIDRVDQQVGRIIEKLKKDKIFDNTLILFLSDNGACPFDRTRKPTLENNYMPWDGRSYYCYPPAWANACNTPWRKYKQDQNEGGISTPLIVHWPKGITVPGTFNRQRGHLVDLHATFRELAGAEYPEEYKGKKIGPARGISLAPSFKGKDRPEHEYLYQNYGNMKTALVKGNWKIVNKKFLYNIENDRTEINDLSQSNPEKFQELLDDFIRLDKELNDGSATKSKEEKKKKKK